MFITFEGIDGSGKSTQIRKLRDFLVAEGYGVVLTREPGGSPNAEDIRALVLQGDPDRWSPEAELLLFNAARRDHVERTIKPSLEAGKVVLCDRFVDSTRALQGAGNPGLVAVLETIHTLMIACNPDLTLIFDIDPSIALQRNMADGGNELRFEGKGLVYHQRVRTIYQDIAVCEPKRCVLINASGSTDEVFARVKKVVMLRLYDS